MKESYKAIKSGRDWDCHPRLVRLVGLVLAWIGERFDGLKNRVIWIGVQCFPKLLLKLCGGYLRFRDNDGTVSVLRFVGVSRVVKSDDPVCRVITISDGNTKAATRSGWLEAVSEFVEDADLEKYGPGVSAIRDVEGFLGTFRELIGDHVCGGLEISEANV